jgi:hypothetical protein
VKRFCVDHFLFNGSLTHSLSPPFTLTYYQSINARTAHMTRGGRKFVVKSFVRPSVRSSIHSLLSVLCNSPAAHVCVYTCVYAFFASSFSLSCVCVCAYSHWWPKGCSEVNFALARSLYVHCLLWCYVKIKTLILGLDQRTDGRAMVVDDLCSCTSI